MTRAFGMAVALATLSISIAWPASADEAMNEFGTKWGVHRVVALYCNDIRPSAMAQQAIVESDALLQEVARATEPASEVEAGIEKARSLASQFVAKPENRSALARESQGGEKCETALPNLSSEVHTLRERAMETWRAAHPARSGFSGGVATTPLVSEGSKASAASAQKQDAAIDSMDLMCAQGMDKACWYAAASKARARSASKIETLRDVCAAGHLLSCVQYNALKDGK